MLATIAAQPARATNVGVSPVNIYLSSGSKTALLTLTNQATQSVNFSLSIYGWTQSETGATELEPTSDIIFFPRQVSIPPGESRNIRLGTQLEPGATERTYRILLEELPPQQTTRVPGVIRLLTNISMPIFVVPNHQRVAVDISGMKVARHNLSFAIQNDGNVHIFPQSVIASGQGASQKTVFAAKAGDVWYILAGGARLVNIPIPPGTCSKIRMLGVTLTTDTAVLRKTLAMPAGACSP